MEIDRYLLLFRVSCVCCVECHQGSLTKLEKARGFESSDNSHFGFLIWKIQKRHLKICRFQNLGKRIFISGKYLYSFRILEIYYSVIYLFCDLYCGVARN